jgi:hypothetical protein
METALQILVMILLATVTGTLNALLSYLLDYCLYPKSIFGRWIPTLAKWLSTKDMRAEISKRRLFGLSQEDSEDQLIESISHKFFYKILGGCIICTNVWLGMLTFTALHFLLPIDFCWWLAPVHILFSSFFLRKIINPQ